MLPSEAAAKENMSWLIVGISGVTCGGKTTLSQSIYEYLSEPSNTLHFLRNNNIKIGLVKLINQDDYFLPEDHPNHKWIQRINHVNFDIISALDMIKMCNDINLILGKRFLFHSKRKPAAILNILLIDGFLVFNHSVVNRLCQLKFHIHLPYEKCFERRKTRIYEPPDVMGYFELCVWPMYEKNFNEIKGREDIILLNGDASKESLFSYVLNCIRQAI